MVQETFLRLCRADPADVEGSISGHMAEWLFTVCRRLAIDARRKESRMSPWSDGYQERPDARPAPDVGLEQTDEVSRVMHSLEDLPLKQREALRLKFQQGLSYKEIAGIMQESIGSVSWWIHKGLGTLRARLNTEALGSSDWAKEGAEA